jgi:hypothetical protein
MNLGDSNNSDDSDAEEEGCQVLYLGGSYDGGGQLMHNMSEGGEDHL